MRWVYHRALCSVCGATPGSGCLSERNSPMQPYEKPPDDDRLMSLVDSALAQPQGEREEYLRHECAGDSQLFEQAIDYVEWDECMGGFLMQPFCSLDLSIPPWNPTNCSKAAFASCPGR